MATANCTVIWSVDGSSQESTTFSVTEDGTIPVLDINSLTVPCTNTQYTIAIDVSQTKFIVVVANQDCTLKANSSGSPAFTLTLKANKPYLWFLNAPWTDVMSADVTSFYLTCAATGTIDVTIRGIYDPTP